MGYTKGGVYTGRRNRYVVGLGVIHSGPLGTKGPSRVTPWSLLMIFEIDFSLV